MVRLLNSAVPSHASQVIGVIERASPGKDEDESIGALLANSPGPR
jgi:hypothetical protein